MMSKGTIFLTALAALVGIGTVLFVLADPEETHEVPRQQWSFQGVFGQYDRPALQRGFTVYRQVCSGCHSMSLLSYRQLAGIGFDENKIKQIAAEVQVPDGPNDQGEMFERPGKPFDRFKAPFANEQAARAANNGALPPDLSLIAKSRAGKGFVGHEGADYIYALLTGYTNPPPGVTVAENMHYNRAFTRGAHQIAMPPPLQDNSVTYEDGTPATLDQQARDVAQFLSWASEPHLEERHRYGIRAVLFLLIATGLAYAAKRKVWSAVH
ncbi:MAG TPA: cytochrome c1 [Dongiaceae bacterium]|jgi:ubiquinol-cytochrome c reductase cytochrome c1 subunit|nr:cytochrome c1 [Dongiaceae bacterium]